MISIEDAFYLKIVGRQCKIVMKTNILKIKLYESWFKQFKKGRLMTVPASIKNMIPNANMEIYTTKM